MSKRILIIDDEENIRRVTRLTLQAAGYEVGEAADGERGLEAFGAGSTWDAVLLDQRMPGMEGLEVLRQIKQRQPGARVIMSTAYASIELAVDAMKLGATDFVRKPMTPEILRNAVAASLAKPQRASEPMAPTTLAAQTSPASAEVSAVPLIQTITMNGFTILEAPAESVPESALESQLESNAAGPAPNERHFTVETPDGEEHEVVVQIDEEAVGYVERMTRRKLPSGNSFWTGQAQRLLSDYLWKEGQVPPTRSLVIKDIDRDDLPMAASWESN